jgi:hypothetical protein
VGGGVGWGGGGGGQGRWGGVDTAAELLVAHVTVVQGSFVTAHKPVFCCLCCVCSATGQASHILHAVTLKCLQWRH